MKASVVAFALCAALGLGACSTAPVTQDPPGGGVQVPVTSRASSSTSAASATGALVTSSPSATATVDTKAISAPATAFVIAYHGIDSSLPYPGWTKESFTGILGGELATRQAQRDASAASPSAGDVTYWKQLVDERVKQAVVIDKVNVRPSSTDPGQWFVEVTWRLTITRKDLTSPRSGSSQFTVVSVAKNAAGQYVAVSDLMPQAP